MLCINIYLTDWMVSGSGICVPLKMSYNLFGLPKHFMSKFSLSNTFVYEYCMYYGYELNSHQSQSQPQS